MKSTAPAAIIVTVALLFSARGQEATIDEALFNSIRSIWLDEKPDQLLDTRTPLEVYLSHSRHSKKINHSTFSIRYTSASEVSFDLHKNTPDSVARNTRWRFNVSDVPAILAALKKYEQWINTAREHKLADGITKDLTKIGSAFLRFNTPDTLYVDGFRGFNATPEDVKTIKEVLLELPQLKKKVETRIADQLASDAALANKYREEQRKRALEQERADSILK